MADLTEEPDEIQGVAQEPPDLSDLEKLIMNVETRDGQQFSLILVREEGKVLSLTADHEGEYEEIQAGSGQLLRTVYSGRQAWEFVVILDDV